MWRKNSDGTSYAWVCTIVEMSDLDERLEHSYYKANILLTGKYFSKRLYVGDISDIELTKVELDRRDEALKMYQQSEADIRCANEKDQHTVLDIVAGFGHKWDYFTTF